MIAEESWIPTIQLVVTTAGTVAVAWIGVQQIRAKAKLVEATKRMERASKSMDDAATQITEATTRIQIPKENE